MTMNRFFERIGEMDQGRVALVVVATLAGGVVALATLASALTGIWLYLLWYGGLALFVLALVLARVFDDALVERHFRRIYSSILQDDATVAEQARQGDMDSCFILVAAQRERLPFWVRGSARSAVWMDVLSQACEELEIA